MLRKICLVLLLAGCNRDLSVPADPGTPLLAVDPPQVSVAPLGKTSFQITGGTPPYALGETQLVSAGEVMPSVALDASGDSISYSAGSLGSVTDTFKVTDADKDELEVRVSVGLVLQILPPVIAVPAGGPAQFHAIGGQPPYHFEVQSACTAYCSTVGADDGTYRGSSSPATSLESVTVTDANGASALASVSLGAGVSLLEGDRLALAPGGSVTLHASGGQGHSFAWQLFGPDRGAAPAGLSLVPSATGSTANLTVDPSFASAGMADAIVSVRDGDLQADMAAPAEAQLYVSQPLQPPQVAAMPVRPGHDLTLTSVHGAPPYRYAFAPRGNLSSGSVTADGLYHAGPNPLQTDTLEVTDANGVSATFTVNVGLSVLARADWEGVIDPQNGGGGGSITQTFPFIQGHFFVSGAHLVLGADGVPRPEPFLNGRLHDVGDFNDDGLPDVLMARFSGGTNTIIPYGGTLSGDLAPLGGGVLAQAAAVGPDNGPQRYVLISGYNNGPPSCSLAWEPFTDFVAGNPPTCGTTTAKSPPPFLVRTSDGVASVDQTGSNVWQQWGTNPISSCAAAVGISSPLPPIAVDLDADGELDLAWVERSAKGYVLDVCLYVQGSAKGTALSMPLPFATDPQLMLGPQLSRGDGRPLPTVLLSDRTTTHLYELKDPKAGAPGLEASTQSVPAGSDGILGTGDADGDGALDVMTWSNFDDIEFHFGDGAGSFDRPSRFRAGPTPSNFDFQVADIDLDGKDDLLVAGSANARLLQGLSFAAPGGNRAALAVGCDTGALGIVGVAGLGDFDGKPGLDMLAVDSSLNLMILPFDAATGQLTTPIQLLNASDLNRDLSTIIAPQAAPIGGTRDEIFFGFRDATTKAFNSLQVWWVEHFLGDTSFPAHDAGLTLNPPVVTESPHFGDVDGDGVVDMVVFADCFHGESVCPSRPIYLYRGQGSGQSFSFNPTAKIVGTIGDLPGWVMIDTARHRVVHEGVVRAGCDMYNQCNTLKIDVFDVVTGKTASRTVAFDGFNLGYDPRRVTLADLGNGVQLVVELAPRFGQPSVLGLLDVPDPSNPGLVLSPPVQLPIGPSTAAVDWVLLDADGDGKLEVLTRQGNGSSSPALHLWHQSGTKPVRFVQ